MKKAGLFLFIATAILSCTDQSGKAPDVSGVKVDLKEKRFDQDFFKLDTNNIPAGMATLQAKYPEFLSIFTEHFVRAQDNETLKTFYRDFKPINDSVQLLYRDFKPVLSSFESAFRYVKHYFPSYELPHTIMPIVGPMYSREDLLRMPNGELTPNFIGQGFLGISLQFYLGSDFSLYNTEYFVNNVAPLFRSRRFSKEYLVPEAMKLICDDIFPDKSEGRPLLEQMIEKGKQWWLMEKFLPRAADSARTGYTQRQLDWCEENEGLIWSHFVQNKLLEAIDQVTLQTYIGESPFTQGLSQQASPGNIGPWIGRQIVRAYASKNPSVSIGEVMQKPAQVVFEGAGYKPK